MSSREITVALVGNPNAGKTSLLNSLAGLNLHVGNWPGKTVTQKQAVISFSNHHLKVTDLPGIYSLEPFSEEEKIARDFIVNKKPDVVVQIIDLNLLERSLLLFFELLALKQKVILALNFNKEAQTRGVKVDLQQLEKILGVPIIPLEANTGENKEKLLKAVIKISQTDFSVPVYVSRLRNSSNLISHRKVRKFIQKNILPFYVSPSDEPLKTEAIDRWILNKFTAWPIFLATIYGAFKITFLFSQPLIEKFNFLIRFLEKNINLIASGWWASFLSQGVLNGVGSVLIFIPLIFSLFLIIAILEDSGYLSRLVILLDYFFAKLGLSGRSFIPMILGLSCNVPAILATRTIKNKRERTVAILINPFISCSARLVVYGLFAGIFFPQKAMLVVMFLYILGVAVALAAALILTRLLPNQEKESFIMELPPYRWPTLKNILGRAWWQTRMFIKKAGSIIFILSLTVWFLAGFPRGVEYGSVDSWIGQLGKFIAPLFNPLGFGHWVFGTVLLFGIVAKEAIIGSLGTLINTTQSGLGEILPQFITPAGALSFLVFVSLYMPCLATLSVIKSETNSWKMVFLQMLLSFTVAWLLAAGVYRLAELIW